MGNCLALEEEQQQHHLSPNPKPERKSRTGGARSPLPTTLKKASAKTNGVISVLAAPKDVEDLRQIGDYGNVMTFTYGELRAATKSFRPDQILGDGGFGIVYKGVIDEIVRPGFKPTQVAVKELNREGFQGDKEWLTEVNYLGQFSHPNLVKLIGYCCEGVHRLLVYEYMACGSLEKHLFRRVCLTMPWSTRMKIALGAAKGLAFLHGAERPIIYRDFKTSNILLDAAIWALRLRQYGPFVPRDYNAKLSDFGLAKEGPMGDQTHVSTRVMGTYGYAAPEYVMTGHLTARSDVYGFGVVLLEMLIGRKAMDNSRPSREHNLVDWARPMLVYNRKLLKIIDPRMEGQYSNRSLQKVAPLAYQCLSQNPKGRPTMCQVVETLENLQDLAEGIGNMLLQSSDTAVTLYEVPKETSASRRDSPTSARGKEYSGKTQGGNNRKVYSQRTKPTTGRSKSEPPKELQLYSPSPHSNRLQP